LPSTSFQFIPRFRCKRKAVRASGLPDFPVIAMPTQVPMRLVNRPGSFTPVLATWSMGTLVKPGGVGRARALRPRTFADCFLHSSIPLLQYSLMKSRVSLDLGSDPSDGRALFVIDAGRARRPIDLIKTCEQGLRDADAMVLTVCRVRLRLRRL
jgi:hypothetical protein